MDLRGCFAAAQMLDPEEVQGATLPAGAERLRDASYQLAFKMTLTPRVPEEREARLEGRGAPAAAFETPRCAGLLRHAAYRIILDAFWYQSSFRANAGNPLFHG
jgi:hypothetical protein